MSRAGVGVSVLLLLSTGCNPIDSQWQAHVQAIDFGVDVRLDAVTYDGRTAFAVGSGGVVASDLGQRWELPATLRDVTTVEPQSGPRLLVVGMDGFAATISPTGVEFELVDVGTDADLWGVTGARFGSSLHAIIVGDDALIVGREHQGEITWSQPPAPPDGWGRLRAVHSALSEPICALGDAGRMVCMTDDPDTWEVQALATDANLTGFCAGMGLRYVVGEGGTLLTRDQDDSWRVLHTKPAIDLVACTTAFYWPLLIGSDRTIYELDDDLSLDPLLELDWQPRAIDPTYGIAMVGDRGRAGFVSITGLIPQ